ncbi:hypothetical protein [Streptomyces sp. NPDC020681]|uniref:hypothetical protein n=1 Tax=Streptomyces sp. NPDC020681 TaxID=3365083 RepID=UPI0037AD9A32
MADERYEWLDKHAAERLLRGEPVETADEHARTQAARLSRALYAAGRPVVPSHPEDGEMPGEASALAAFRKARADAAADPGDSLGTIRLATSAPGSTMGARLRRPVRFGLAAAVAGCALGGVAVAAGTGLLPSPFDSRPLPASSVSAAATPGPLLSESPSGGTLAPPVETPGPVTSPPVSPPASGGASPDPTGRGDGNGDDRGDSDGKDRRRAELYRKTVEACRQYRDGTIDPQRKKRLEIVANGPGRVQEFCDRLLDGDSRDGNGGGDGSHDGGGTGDGKNDGDDGGPDSDGGGSSGPSMPPVSWTKPQPLPAPAPSENTPTPAPSGIFHTS